MRLSSRSVLLAVTFCVLGTYITAAQTVIFVDADATGAGNGTSWADAYTAVQPALNAAQPGDQVWAATGRYVENITLALGVALYGGFAGTEDPATFDLSTRDFVANETILDGSQSGSVVTGPAGATETTRIDGFTITNGSGTPYGEQRYGGGVYLQSSSPTIANNTIKDNDARRGGGLYSYASNAMLVSNNIARNSAEYGGGFYLYTGTPFVANSRITDNTASAIGGGLYVGYTNAIITNNTITDNTAVEKGGGLSMCGSSSLPTIANTIIAFNSSGVYRCAEGGAPAIRHCCVYGNTAYDYSGVSDPTGTNGNISVDPLFAARSFNNWHIQAGSPCVDVGNNAYVVGTADMEGQPRIQPSAGAVDIGADESDGTLWEPGPYAIVRVSPSGNDDNDGSSWELAKRTVQAGIDAASARGGQVWVAAGTYDECVTLLPYAHVYGGFAGNETQLAERDWTTNIAILDGQQQGSVVNILAGEGVSTIDGLTITNGSGSVLHALLWGGGLYVFNCSPMIANNTIIANAADYGGGLCVRWGSPEITNNAISENSALRSGGGLYAEHSALRIAANAIAGNVAESGGGATCVSSDPTFVDNVISGNRADSGSAALYFGGGVATITSNTIIDNGPGGYWATVTLDYGSGFIVDNTITGNTGGLELYLADATVTGNTISGTGDASALRISESTVTIADNTIAYNTTFGESEAAGITVYSSTAAIMNNTIVGNSAPNGVGGMRIGDSALTIVNNTISQNSGRYGGGLSLYCATLTAANNTITSNMAADDGGAIYLSDSSGTIVNTIVAFNSSGVFRTGWGDPPTLRHNCVFGNAAYDFSGMADPTGSDGNISDDPVLASREYGNLHLQPESPCVGAGDNAYATGDHDIDGQPRIQGPDATVDMGADESDGTVWGPGPYVIVRVSPMGDDSNDGSSWTLAKRTVQAGIDLAAALGGEVWVQAGTYGERIALYPHAYLYGGFAGMETSRDERDWVVNVTTLDGEQQGTVIVVLAGLHANTIDGFTITNGSGTVVYSTAFGGGIHAWYASPTVRNNIITNNSTTSRGGGVNLWGRSTTIENNIVTNNVAIDHMSFGSGGGLYVNGVSVTVVGNTISGNYTSCGGGLAAGGTAMTVTNNTIAGNNASVGGGLYLEQGSVTVSDNLITENSAYSSGGGLSAWGAATIIGNAVRSNSAVFCGGGVSAGGSAVIVANNMVTENRITGSDGFGGGLYISGSLSVVNNVVMGNGTLGIGGMGGGLSVRYHASPTISGNMIIGNFVTGSDAMGGGLSVYYDSAPTIVNNVIVGNSIVDSSERGGGLAVCYANPTIANTIVAFNSSGVFVYDTTSTASLLNNCVHGNAAFDYSGLTDPTGTNGNISTDPVFVEAPDPGPDGVWATADDNYGNLRLLADSPCIDSGNNPAVPPDLLIDLDGLPRFVDGDGDLIATVDMGAYENQDMPATCPGDGNCDGVITWRDVDYFVASMNDNLAAWQALFAPGGPTCPFANNDVNADGTVSWRDIDALVAVMNTECP